MAPLFYDKMLQKLIHNTYVSQWISYLLCSENNEDMTCKVDGEGFSIRPENPLDSILVLGIYSQFCYYCLFLCVQLKSVVNP